MEGCAGEEGRGRVDVKGLGGMYSRLRLLREG